MTALLSKGTIQGFEFSTGDPVTILWTVDIDYEVVGVRSSDPQWDQDISYRIGRLMAAWLVGPSKLSGPAIELFNHQAWQADQFTQRFRWLVDVLNDELPQSEVMNAINDDITFRSSP